MNRDRWIALTVGLSTVAVVLTLLWVEAHGQYKLQSAAPATCADETTKELILELTLQAYDKAFMDHTVKLWTIWLSDPDQTPVRAQKGTQNGINAYVRAREGAMKWDMPTC